MCPLLLKCECDLLWGSHLEQACYSHCLTWCHCPLPQSDSSQCRTLGVRGSFLGFCECQVCCPPLGAPSKYFLSFIAGLHLLFVSWWFFFCLFLSDIVKGMRSLREVLRTVETKATQTFKMVRGMNGRREGGCNVLCKEFCFLTIAVGQKIFFTWLLGIFCLF